MDEINKLNETMKRMQESVSVPSDAAADFDEDDLEAELEELEGAELEEQLLLPVATVSAAPEHDITGLLPAPLFLRGQTRRMNLLICRLRWHFGQVDLFLYFQELLLSISLLLVYY